jgi:plasmid stabilization system protein ParE
MEQCQCIATSPMGYVGREDLAPGLRIAALGRYVIFFRVLEHDSKRLVGNAAFD